MSLMYYKYLMVMMAFVIKFSAFNNLLGRLKFAEYCIHDRGIP